MVIKYLFFKQNEHINEETYLHIVNDIKLRYSLSDNIRVQWVNDLLIEDVGFNCKETGLLISTASFFTIEVAEYLGIVRAKLAFPSPEININWAVVEAYQLLDGSIIRDFDDVRDKPVVKYNLDFPLPYNNNSSNMWEWLTTATSRAYEKEGIYTSLAEKIGKDVVLSCSNYIPQEDEFAINFYCDISPIRINDSNARSLSKEGLTFYSTTDSPYARLVERNRLYFFSKSSYTNLSRRVINYNTNSSELLPSEAYVIVEKVCNFLTSEEVANKIMKENEELELKLEQQFIEDIGNCVKSVNFINKDAAITERDSLVEGISKIQKQYASLVGKLRAKNIEIDKIQAVIDALVEDRVGEKAAEELNRIESIPHVIGCTFAKPKFIVTLDNLTMEYEGSIYTFCEMDIVINVSTSAIRIQSHPQCRNTYMNGKSVHPSVKEFGGNEYDNFNAGDKTLLIAELLSERKYYDVVNIVIQLLQTPMPETWYFKLEETAIDIKSPEPVTV